MCEQYLLLPDSSYFCSSYALLLTKIGSGPYPEVKAKKALNFLRKRRKKSRLITDNSCRLQLIKPQLESPCRVNSVTHYSNSNISDI